MSFEKLSAYCSIFLDADDFEPEAPVAKSNEKWEGEDEDVVKVGAGFLTHACHNHSCYFIS